MQADVILKEPPCTPLGWMSPNFPGGRPPYPYPPLSFEQPRTWREFTRLPTMVIIGCKESLKLLEHEDFRLNKVFCLEL